MYPATNEINGLDAALNCPANFIRSWEIVKMQEFAVVDRFPAIRSARHRFSGTPYAHLSERELCTLRLALLGRVVAIQ